jgi:predicted small lipoprotein YifL
MLNVRQILMSAAGLFAIGVGLAGCGLKGPLYMPTVPEAANRATLPSLILPSTRSDAATAAPADAAVAPPAAASSAPASTGVAK